MRVHVHEISGIQAQTAAKMKAIGIAHSDQLLSAAGDPKARSELAQKLGIETRQLLELTNRADLARIKGIGSVYADLLETAGVDSVVELATRKPEKLLTKLLQIANYQGIRRTPNIAQVESWIEQAKTLDRKVYH